MEDTLGNVWQEHLHFWEYSKMSPQGRNILPKGTFLQFLYDLAFQIISLLFKLFSTQKSSE
jgi:hypothetical protein